MAGPDSPYVSRGGLKLAHGLEAFGIDPRGLVCADLGCSTGGFTDVLLRRGAARVYAVDTGYGVLDWRLRNDPHVIVLERSNALHVELPEPVGLVTIDAGWTRQATILPRARRLLAGGGEVITLVKPQYEADPGSLRRTGGVLPANRLDRILEGVRRAISGSGFAIVAETPSPIRGSAGRSARGNLEVLMHLRPDPGRS